jgi:hypothetical protein
MSSIAVRDTTPVQIAPERIQCVLNGRPVWLKRRPDQEVRLRRLPQLQALDDFHVWEGHGFRVMCSLDKTHHGQLRHVSVSRADRHPTWEEITRIRTVLFAPETDVMMVMPREADYVNVHEHCFHLWQTPTDWAVQ